MPGPAFVAPTCLSLIVCDLVIEDARSRNKSLISMFNGILAPELPARHERMCVFAAFSAGRGRVPISLRLCHDADYEQDLLHLGGDVDFTGHAPRDVVDLVFEIQGFVFTRFGDYSFEVLCNSVPLLTRRFSVSQLTMPPGATPPPASPPPSAPPSEPTP